MKIGFIVEGESEYYGLPIILRKIQQDCKHSFVQTALVKTDPQGARERIKKACMSRIYQLVDAGADCVVIALDRETRPDCPGVLAQQLQRYLQNGINGKVKIVVVLKDRTFENWLISDFDSLCRMRPFARHEKRKRSIVPGRADSVNAGDIISREHTRT